MVLIASHFVMVLYRTYQIGKHKCDKLSIVSSTVRPCPSKWMMMIVNISLHHSQMDVFANDTVPALAFILK